jgi:hypothetical protein
MSCLQKREDWVTTRSASEWREFYQKHHKDIDTRAKQLGYIPLELATSTTANLTDAQDKRDIGQLAQAKQLKNIPNKLAASTSTTATLTDAQDKKDIEQLAQYFAQHKIKEDERRQATFFDKLPRKHVSIRSFPYQSRLTYGWPSRMSLSGYMLVLLELGGHCISITRVQSLNV